MKFRSKILLVFLLVVAASIVSLGFSFSSWARQNIRNNAIEANILAMNQMDDNISAIQRNLWDFSTLFILNPAKYATSESLRELISSQDKLSIVAYFSDQYSATGRSFLSAFNTGLITYPELKKTDIYRRAVAAGGKAVFQPLPKDRNELVTNLRADSIAMLRSIRGLDGSFQPAGVLMMVVPQNVFSRLRGHEAANLERGVAIFDSAGQLLYHSQLAEETARELPHLPAGPDGRYSTLTAGGRNLLAFQCGDNEFDWKVFMTADEASLYGGSYKEMLGTAALVMAVTLIAAFIIIVCLSAVLTKPIAELTASLAHLGEGDLNHRVQVKSHDEIGRLGARYNEMLDRLGRLDEENRLLAQREREAELNALQAQINPHFLYNILTIIYCRSFAAGQPELAEVTLALSKLFRLSLNQGRPWFTVAMEKELLEQYLALQKARFQERLSYAFEIDESIMECPIPKLILQPLVENAIAHGVEKMAEGALVTISGRLAGGRLVLSVSDNGPGMSEEQLREVSRRIKDAPQGGRSGYALWNVRERLSLYYRDDFSFEFISQEGAGVCARIEIPVLERASDNF